MQRFPDARHLACVLAVTTLVTPGLAAALEKQEREALVILLLGDKPNDVKTCMNAALRLNNAYTALRIAQADDASVRDRSLQGVTDPALHEHRERELALWRESKAPGQVAENHFEYCLRRVDIHLTLGPLGRTCFSLQFVASMARVLRDIGRSRDDARDLVRTSFAAQVGADYVDQIAIEVFDAHGEEADEFAQRRAFARCVVSTREAPTQSTR